MIKSVSTRTRPQMSEAQASLYASTLVMQHIGTNDISSWDPIAPALEGAKSVAPASYRVDPKASKSDYCFQTIQTAINQVVLDAKAGKATGRQIIDVKPGQYNELVYVPEISIDGIPIPITLRGVGDGPEETAIAVDIDQGMSGDDYAERFEASFESLDSSIRDMFQAVADRGDFDIGTTNACVMRVRNTGFQAINLTLENSYNEDRITADTADLDPSQLHRNAKGQLAEGQHQAVALLIDAADRVHFDKVRLYGDQDTFYIRTDTPDQPNKCYFSDCYLEGDVDYIFGNGTVLFERCEIESKAARRSMTYVAAPSTSIHAPYGFVFNACNFTFDNAEAPEAGSHFLCRQWFERVRCTPYGKAPIKGYQCILGDRSHYEEPTGTISKKTLEAVGKMVVLNSKIGAHINAKAPWTDWKGGLFDIEGNYIPSEWNTRFRPVQYQMEDFLTNLGDWLKEQNLTYDRTDDDLPFIAEFNNSTNE